MSVADEPTDVPTFVRALKESMQTEAAPLATGSARVVVPPHKDPKVSAKARHIMWSDRQDAFQAWVGMIFAFVLAVLFLAASVLLIMNDHEVSGTILGTVDLVALVTVFIMGRQGAKATG
ncbi:hypothetical protein [Amycolatopsis sp. NPDC004169]|uniref:hypothetical protein n=1 Tax=Amycolatopsis sp. NPDC004169 TaxID=3154453 RepID=UPI0033A649AA